MRPLIAKTELGGKRRLLLSPLMAALLGLGMTGFITLVCVWIQPGSFLDTLRAFYHQPLLILLNWFPVIVLTAVVYFLLGNLFYAGSVSGVITEVGIMCSIIIGFLRHDRQSTPSTNERKGD